MDESWLVVSEAARELGVSPQRVRSLLDSGALHGHKVGRSWLVDPQDAQRRAGHEKHPGRPLSPRNAWLLVSLLTAAEHPLRDAKVELSKLGRRGDPPKISLRIDLSRSASAKLSAINAVTTTGGVAKLLVPVGLPHSVSAKDRSLLRSLVAEIPGPEGFFRLMESRASVCRMRVHPGVVARSMADKSVSVGGGAAVAALGGGVAGGGRPRIYVAAVEFGDLSKRYRWVRDVEGNIDVAVIPSDVDPELMPAQGAFVPIAVAWADLLDDPDSRAREAARDWVRRLPRPLEIADGRRR